jgi:hypothetical protein
MQSTIEAQNWQAYLHFRQLYIKSGGKQSEIAKMIRSLPDETQLLYGRYFKSYRELSVHVRELLNQENAVDIAKKQAERQAAYEQRISASSVNEKPIKRGKNGQTNT